MIMMDGFQGTLWMQMGKITVHYWCGYCMKQVIEMMMTANIKVKCLLYADLWRQYIYKKVYVQILYVGYQRIPFLPLIIIKPWSVMTKALKAIIINTVYSLNFPRQGVFFFSFASHCFNSLIACLLPHESIMVMIQ